MKNGRTLERALGLGDVYALATGAMFSAGFFLLPGLAAVHAGSWVPLAYIIAGLFMLPPMLSVAELATGMPRAGGAYYFLDRAFGPAVGTVGGLGTWVALVLKSAFSLLGMGAYLALLFDIPVEPLAVAFTAVFAWTNLSSAEATGRLQRILVFAMVGILMFWLAAGIFFLTGMETMVLAERFATQPTGEAGLMGNLLATAGLVFVSYAGLTKVASVAQEVKQPDRNIPLGMGLALLTAVGVYGGGVALVVAALPMEVLTGDLTPIASAGLAFLPAAPSWLVESLIVVAAVAAFASTGNAGILAASRYPLAMAWDRLMPQAFAKLNAGNTPIVAVLSTAGIMVLFIVAFDIAAVAKLASAFQLMLFSLLSVAVVVMRESRIGYYQPGFRSPLYPWVQIAGFLGPLFLIAQMGAMAVVFTAALCMGSLAWYHFYARGKVKRDGAIYHVFERLGRNRDLGLDRELREILGERTEGDQDGFDRLVSSAVVVDHPGGEEFQTLLEKVCGRLAARHHVNVERLVEMIVAETRLGLMPVARGVALPHLRLPGLDDPEMVILRVRGGVEIEVAPEVAHLAAEGPVYAILLLASPEADPSRHLRMLARLASRVDTDGFLAEWRAGQGPRDLRAALLRVSKTPSPSDSDEDPRRSTPNTRPPGVSAPPREAT